HYPVYPLLSCEGIRDERIEKHLGHIDSPDVVAQRAAGILGPINVEVPLAREIRQVSKLRQFNRHFPSPYNERDKSDRATDHYAHGQPAAVPEGTCETRMTHLERRHSHVVAGHERD